MSPADAVPPIQIVGAPFDLCGLRLGSRLGPAAVRLAGLRPALEAAGLTVRDPGDPAYVHEPTEGPGLRNFEALYFAIRGTRDRVAAAFETGAFPLVLGGEHTLSAASVGAALDATGGDLAVLWIDAHADVNTPGSSDTGNIHGMPIAALAGMPSETDDARIDREWGQLKDALGATRLDPARVAWFGLRDVDPAERAHLKGLPITMHEIDRYGIEACLGRVFEWLARTGCRNLWISFDVDALDPFLAPGTGTAVRGGLSYREAHLLAELLSEWLGGESCPVRLVGLDVMETNPIFDANNGTATVAVEWIASLFGKRILGGATAPLGMRGEA